MEHMEDVERMTWEETVERMTRFNLRNPHLMEKACIFAVVVFKPGNWTLPYTLEQRSYKISNANRRFQPGKISNGVYGDCLDGRDLGVRLDWHDWTVDYCYWC